MDDRQIAEAIRERIAEYEQKIEQMKGALAVFLGEDALPPTRTRSVTGSATGSRSRPVSGSGFRTRKGKTSIAQHVYELLHESGRDWSAPEMVTEFEHRGIQVYPEGAKDRTKNVRFQLAELAKSGRAERVGEGRYRPAKAGADDLRPFQGQIEGVPALNGAGSVHAEEGG